MLVLVLILWILIETHEITRYINTKLLIICGILNWDLALYFACALDNFNLKCWWYLLQEEFVKCLGFS